MKTTKCTKCNGTGYIGHYGHVAGGVCFDCNGAGTTNVRRPRKSQAKVVDPTIALSNEAKVKELTGLYEYDPRLADGVTPAHPYWATHVRELAQLDKKW